ncbi:MAG: hypothetical protein HYT35_00435, partial [Candidatus Staskawiczbacteria bacterium]|nr:hypothetical protein [Candidatus Staskawiczbacteria bacterium]
MFFSKLATIVLLSLVMMLDLTFTLVGQPESYWQDYSCCNEASPIGSFLLSIDPKIFVLSFAV